jgi:hypothetical protein
MLKRLVDLVKVRLVGAALRKTKLRLLGALRLVTVLRQEINHGRSRIKHDRNLLLGVSDPQRANILLIIEVLEVNLFVGTLGHNFALTNLRIQLQVKL